ncbi:MAG: EF-P lysine aminoacylase GenX [Chromatiales bacterium]|nr:EF-P lysine aminoacylase GenX [Chromatiales bacterium]
MATPWEPAASFANIRARAKLLADIRAYFQNTGVLEVETPVCSAAGTTDPAIESFSSHYTGPGYPEGLTCYLHTSPEFPMKRLLAAGSGSIYQICKVFRAAESGPRHNPEFTLLEWYRVGYDHLRLMDDVSGLICSLQSERCEVEKLTYAQAFQRYLAIDPHSASIAELHQCAREQGISLADDFQLPDRDAWLDLLMSHLIEPKLGQDGLCFIYDYPASQASLARIREDEPPVAERFELYWRGVELANGFHELTDAVEQERRFLRDQKVRAAHDQPQMPMDRHLLAALAQGLPDCAGVALGVDRLLMLLSGAQHINDVLAFPLERA